MDKTILSSCKNSLEYPNLLLTVHWIVTFSFIFQLFVIGITKFNKSSFQLKFQEKELEHNMQEMDKKKKSLDEVYEKKIVELQKIAGLSRDEAMTCIL